MAQEVQLVDDVHVLSKILPISDAKTIKTIAFALEKKFGNAVFAFGNVANDKPMLTVIISENLTKSKNWNAGNFVRAMAKEVGGGGGGQATFATAGGQQVNGLQKALDQLKTLMA